MASTGNIINAALLALFEENLHKMVAALDSVESGRLDPHDQLAWSGSRPRHVGEGHDVG